MTDATIAAYAPEVVERAREIGDLIQSAVAARIMADPDYAATMYAVGFDALSSSLRQSPSALIDNGPLIALVVDVYNYVVTGEGGPDVFDRLRLTFANPGPDTP